MNRSMMKIFSSLLVVTLLGVAAFAIPSSNSPNPNSSELVQEAVVSVSLATNGSHPDLGRDIDRDSLDEEFVQAGYYPAAVCYTPITSCPMVVAVPAGSSCTCYGPGGWSSGTAW